MQVADPDVVFFSPTSRYVTSHFSLSLNSTIPHESLRPPPILLLAYGSRLSVSDTTRESPDYNIHVLLSQRTVVDCCGHFVDAFVVTKDCCGS